MLRAMLTARNMTRLTRGGRGGRSRWTSWIRRRVLETLRTRLSGGSSTRSNVLAHCGSSSWNSLWTRNKERRAVVTIVRRRRSQAVWLRLGACWQHREQLTITKTASGFGSCGIVARRMAEVGVSSCQVDGLGCDRGAQLKAGR